VHPNKKALAGRRHFLGLIPAALLAACGGHGDDGIQVVPDPSPSSPVSTGLLVYRTGSRIGVYDLALRRETLFAPQGALIEGTGVSVSRQRKIAVLENRNNFTYNLDTYDVQGTRVQERSFFAERTIVVGTAALSPDGRWSAVARNEPIDIFGPFTFRVHIFEMTVPESQAQHFFLTGYTDPVWAGNGGQLMARKVDDGTLHLFSALVFADLGALPGVRVDDSRAGYDVSADGRHVVFLRDDAVRMLDRSDNTQWAALLVASGTLTQPAFTPDGTALLAVWHRSTGEVVVLVPWLRGAPLQVTEAMILTAIATGQFDGRLSTAP